MKQIGDEKGYTMLEAIMYISLMIILGSSLASYAGHVMKRYRTGRVAQQIIDLKKAILHYTAVSDNYMGLSRDGMIAGKAMPMDMNHGYHALNGEIQLGCVYDIAAPVAETNDKYMFYVTFRNLPDVSCVEILTQGQFYGDGSEMDTLIVNDTYGWNYEYSLYTATIPSVMKTFKAEEGKTTGIYITIGEAMTACNKKTDNFITWVFS